MAIDLNNIMASMSQYNFDMPGEMERWQQDLAAAQQADRFSQPNSGLTMDNMGAGFNTPLTSNGQQVYSTTQLGENGGLDAKTNYYLQGDPNMPANATQAMAGGYSAGSWGGGLGGFLGNAMEKAPAIAAGSAGLGVGGVSGASAATGNGITPQTVGADAAGLAAGVGLAGAGLGSSAGLTGLGSPEGIGGLNAGSEVGATIGAGGGGLGGGTLGSGLTAGQGTADVLGTGGTLSGGAYSSAGGSGLLAGGNAAGGLSVTPAMSEAAGFGGATGALTGNSAAATSGFGSIVGALGGWGNIIGTGATIYGLNQLQNSYKNLANQASNYSSLDQPQRAPYQQNLSNLVNNPSQYLNTDPFATSLASFYKNNVIPRNIAQSGNAAKVLDEQGSQFVNAISQNYNTQVGQLSGIAGFGFPQSSYAGYMGGQLGAGGAIAQAGQTAALGNFLGQNLGKIQGQSGSNSPFGTVTF